MRSPKGVSKKKGGGTANVEAAKNTQCSRKIKDRVCHLPDGKKKKGPFPVGRGGEKRGPDPEAHGTGSSLLGGTAARPKNTQPSPVQGWEEMLREVAETMPDEKRGQTLLPCESGWTQATRGGRDIRRAKRCHQRMEKRGLTTEEFTKQGAKKLVFGCAYGERET